MQHIVQPPNRRLISLLFTIVAITGGITIYGISSINQAKESTNQPVESTSATRAISALGRLEPATEVIQLAAPMALDGDRLLELRVKEGDRVKANQIIAVLGSRDRLQDAVRRAQEQVRQAQARLAQIRAGAKEGEVQAQQAAIVRLRAEIDGARKVQAATLDRLEAEYQNAQIEYNRYQQLYQEGAISQSALDSRRLTATTAQKQWREAQENQNRTIETLQAQLQEATATLDRIAEVRPVDVQVAQTEVDGAIAALTQAKTDLEQAYIRAPFAGQILKIHTRPGEKLNENGIADLGQTDQMEVVAEVYQSDISNIRSGQTAFITGQGFSGRLRGKVSQVGWQVSRQNTFSNQPGENLDRRVVEVRIALTPADSRQVAQLTNMQVQVAIEP
jgi:HlyD family secretion protein